MVLHKKTRRLFFYALALLFLFLTPIILGISFGYRFDFVTGAVEQTGGVFIKSKTPSLSIFLNGMFAKETSFLPGGALIPEIMPGTYLLRVEKAGYTSWSKTVSVDPSIVTELRSVLFIPNPTVTATTTAAETLVLNLKPAPPPYIIDKKFNLIRKNGISTKTLAANVYSFGVLEDSIYFIEKNGFLAKIDLVTNAVETIGHPGFYLESTPAQFFKSPAGDVAITDSVGGLYLLDLNRQISVIGTGAKKIRFDAKGEKALIIRGNEIELLWMRDNTYQPFEKRGTKEKILGIEAEIEDAHWLFYDNAHVVVQTKDGIYLTETDGRGGRNTIELFTGKTDEIITRQENPNSIFYRIGKIWHKIEI